MLTLTVLYIRGCVRVRDAMTPVGEYARTTESAARAVPG